MADDVRRLKELKLEKLRRAQPGTATSAQAPPGVSPEARAAHSRMDTVRKLKEGTEDFVLDALPLGLGVAGGAVGNIPGATLGGMAGEAFQQLGRRATGRGEVPASAADAVKDIEVSGALQGLPVKAAEVAGPAIKKVARGVMQSALKPGIEAVLKGDAAKAISTLLDEGVNVTHKGAEQLRASIADLNQKITTAISGSNDVVAKHSLLPALKDTLDHFTNQVAPGADLQVIKQTWDDFLNHPLLQNIAGIPVQLAQKLKQGTYQVLKDKYGEVGSAATEAQKSLARGLKEGIAAKVPAVKDLNARESDLINALKLVNRRVGVEGNKNPLGLATLAPSVEKAITFLLDRSGWSKSMIARALSSGSESIPKNTLRALGVGGQMIGGEPDPAQIKRGAKAALR